MATATLWPQPRYGHSHVMATATLWPQPRYGHSHVMATATLWPQPRYERRHDEAGQKVGQLDFLEFKDDQAHGTDNQSAHGIHGIEQAVQAQERFEVMIA